MTPPAQATAPDEAPEAQADARRVLWSRVGGVSWRAARWTLVAAFAVFLAQGALPVVRPRLTHAVAGRGVLRAANVSRAMAVADPFFLAAVLVTWGAWRRWRAAAADDSLRVVPGLARRLPWVALLPAAVAIAAAFGPATLAALALDLERVMAAAPAGGPDALPAWAMRAPYAVAATMTLAVFVPLVAWRVFQLVRHAALALPLAWLGASLLHHLATLAAGRLIHAAPGLAGRVMDAGGPLARVALLDAVRTALLLAAALPLARLVSGDAARGQD